MDKSGNIPLNLHWFLQIFRWCFFRSPWHLWNQTWGLLVTVLSFPSHEWWPPYPSDSRMSRLSTRRQLTQHRSRLPWKHSALAVKLSSQHWERSSCVRMVDADREHALRNSSWPQPLTPKENKYPSCSGHSLMKCAEGKLPPICLALAIS